MKQKVEKGFTLIETAIAIAVLAMIALAGTAVTFQALKATGQSNDRMTAIPQVQNAGYWISRDAQMAKGILVDNLEPPKFIILSWKDYENGATTHHEVTYFFEDLSGGVGKLKRNHWSSAGADEETLIAQHIYYDPDDPDNTDNTSIANYDSPELTVRLRALFGDASVTREYKAVRRPNL